MAQLRTRQFASRKARSTGWPSCSGRATSANCATRSRDYRWAAPDIDQIRDSLTLDEADLVEFKGDVSECRSDGAVWQIFAGRGARLPRREQVLRKRRARRCADQIVRFARPRSFLAARHPTTEASHETRFVLGALSSNLLRMKVSAMVGAPGLEPGTR